MKTVNELLEERGNRYGVFEHQAIIAQKLISAIQLHLGRTNWESLNPDQREALQMICNKLGRITNGDPDYSDSWRDIAGYATLIADRLDSENEDTA
jgi:hypothetical protein